MDKNTAWQKIYKPVKATNNDYFVAQPVPSEPNIGLSVMLFEEWKFFLQMLSL